MKKEKGSLTASRKTRAALTPEVRENQLIALSYDVAEKQMREGTASAQVISHFLKLGSTKAQLEKELLEQQRDLAAAKIDTLKAAQRIEELYSEAMKAMRSYQGEEVKEEENDEEY